MMMENHPAVPRVQAVPFTLFDLADTVEKDEVLHDIAEYRSYTFLVPIAHA